MLQTVKRPSIASPRMALPAYSTAHPLPAATPTSPIKRRMVLALRAGREPTVERYAHRFRLALHAGLCRQDVGEFATADPPGQCTQRADGAAVAITSPRKQRATVCSNPTLEASPVL